MWSFALFAIQPLHAATPYTPAHPDPVLEPWRWRSFPELKGLGLACLAEGREGNMWFGVAEGARRYDGVNWTAFTEADGILGAPVVALLGTGDGSVYAGTPEGISRFREGKWQRFFPPEGGPTWPVFDLLEAADGSVWAGTGWGALHFGQAGTVLYTSGEVAASVRALLPGLRAVAVPDAVAPVRPWTGIGVLNLTIRRSVEGVTGGTPVIGAVAPGGPAEAAGLKVGDRFAVLEQDSASLTLEVYRAGAGGPFRVSVKGEEVEGGIRDFQAFDVYEAPDGRIWFGLLQGEIVRYDPRAAGAAAWRLFSEADGLDAGAGPHILQTRDGTVWTVSNHAHNRVNRFDGKAWTRFSMRDVGDGRGSDNHTSILETEDGTLWIGGYRYLYALREGAWRVYSAVEAPMMPWHRMRLLQASDGALWVAGLGQEAARLDAATSRWTTYEGLAFKCETPDGSRWFITRPDSAVVRYDGRSWTRYGVADGLMDWPYKLVVDTGGNLWAAGSHDSTAATARFDGNRWAMETHPQLARWISPRGVYAAPDGSVWFGSMEADPERGQLGGALRFDGETWTHFRPPEVPGNYFYGIGQTADGTVWAGGVWGLMRYDGQAWAPVAEPEGVTRWVDRVYAGLAGDLWVGTRLNGLFHYDGREWTRYDVRDGLAENGIRSILQTADGSVWVATIRGVSRFDGRTWTTHALPPDIYMASNWVSLAQSRDGAVWVNGIATEENFKSVRYEPDAVPPETEITLSVKEVSQPGNTTLAWRGADPWKATPDGEVQFAWRLNGGAWSPFSSERNRVFEALAPGDYTFEVKARDRDLNEDPTPAQVAFTVVPPVWRQPWFIALMAVLLGTIGIQARRILASNRKLREANTAMSMANKELFEANRVLNRERALERARAEVTSMQDADDLKDVVQEMLGEIASAGVSYELCVINIVDEGADRVRKLTTAKGGWSEASETRLSDMSDQFREIYKGDKPVVRDATEALKGYHRVVKEHAGPQADIAMPTAILDVPFTYGTLSLSTAEENGFSRESIDLIAEFADVIALGYARFLDFQRLEEQNRALEEANRQIQEANRLKSQFLANMSHELRTPMNAIIGFTRMVLRKAKDLLPERQVDNLEKVRASADHLLGLINEILDLSKIEAGRVDVQAAPFDVKRMVEGCCATVGPSMGKPGVVLHCEVADDAGQADTDEARLRQVVINMLSNALKFTDEGEVRVRAVKEDGDLVIAVTDTGIGIPAEKLEKIFEEFEQVDGSSTRKHGGTGLGLAITRRLAELLGGTIAVESEEGKGSTFTVRVPALYGSGELRVASSESLASSPAPRPRAGGGGRTIVVIDDDPNVAVLLRQELEEEGYRVVSAQNADEGIARVKAVKPVAVTVDIVMPHKDGWDTIRMLKADPDTRDVPVIVMSVSDNRELGFRLGVRDYLVKPVDADSLLAAIGRLDSGEVRDVLVVDDDPTTLSLFQEMLEGSGLEPRTAENGAEALAEIGRRRPDAILLDLMMPVMDGFEVIEKLQADPNLKQIPVVVVTAKDLSREEEAFLQERVSRVVEKGRLDPDALTAELKGMLERYGAGPRKGTK